MFALLKWQPAGHILPGTSASKRANLLKLINDKMGKVNLQCTFLCVSYTPMLIDVMYVRHNMY